MLTLTAKDGSKVTVDPRLVKRVRRTVAGEDDSGMAKTRIDWVQMQLVREDAGVVAEAVRATLTTFTSLTSRDSSRIWFDGRLAEGPFSLNSIDNDGVVRSAVRLMNQKLLVTESPDQVRVILAASGGKVLP